MIDPANDGLREAVAGVLGRDVHGMAEGLLLVSTEELINARNLLDVAITEHVQALDARCVTVSHCAATTKGWLTRDLRLGAADAATYTSVARILPLHEEMAAALREGRMNLEHARAISICLRKTHPDLREVVEKELITLAEEVDPATLAAFAREIADRLGGNDSAEEAAQRKYASRWARLTATYDGMHRLDGMLDPESAAVIKAALAPLLTKLGPDDERSAAQRMADGLVSIAELALRSHTLPELGGEPAQIIATLPASDLFASVSDIIGKTGLLNGQPVTITTIRKWACDAGIIPAVLSGDGEVLDLGRKTPTWSPAQRRALRIEDRGCGWPGCQEPLHRCRIHHIDWWSRHGHTTTKRGIHLCPFHHHLVHHTGWNIDRGPDRKATVWRT